jgi:MoxR-vWA-beta-propeller ternary system domain bpX2
MITQWEDVRCASIPLEDLSALADLRHEAGIRVTIIGDRAWVYWDDGARSEATRRILLERLLPLAGAEMFLHRDGRWHRPGECLPAFDVPIGDGSSGAGLDRVILPQPLRLLPPAVDAPRAVPLRLKRDRSGWSRPVTAARCRLADLADWAERVPSTWIESLSGAWCALDADPDRAEVLLLGRAGLAAREEPRPPGSSRLPALNGGLRFWGRDVLIPLGERTEPDLPERALRDVVGARDDELVVLDAEGPELIPRQAFRPLCRASIRLARAAWPSRPGRGGGQP